MDIRIGHNLKTLRIQNKKTLEEVAEIINVSRQSVSKWESGKSYPNIEKCIKLAQLYNVSLDALVNKTVKELVKEENDHKVYMFGFTKLNDNGIIQLPTKAIEALEMTSEDILLVVGDKRQEITIVKCCGINDFIDENM